MTCVEEDTTGTDGDTTCVEGDMTGAEEDTTDAERDLTGTKGDTTEGEQGELQPGCITSSANDPVRRLPSGESTTRSLSVKQSANCKGVII